MSELRCKCRNWGANVGIEEQRGHSYENIFQQLDLIMSRGSNICTWTSGRGLSNFLIPALCWMIVWWFHYKFLFAPQFRHLHLNSDIWSNPPKMANFGAQKRGKKRHLPNPYWFGLFAKKRIKIAQIWPLWRHLHFTAAYMGSPPCTLSQHPNIKETGYSNVLVKSWPWCLTMASLAWHSNQSCGDPSTLLPIEYWHHSRSVSTNTSRHNSETQLFWSSSQIEAE